MPAKKTATAFTPRSAETVTKYLPYPTPKTPHTQNFIPSKSPYTQKKSHLHIQPLPRLNMSEIRDKILHEPDDGGLVEGGLTEKVVQATEHIVYFLHGLAGCVANDPELMEAIPVYLLGFGIELFEGFLS